MSNDNTKPRLLVDWSATLWAGVVAGIVFYILSIILIPYVYGGSSSIIIRYLSSIVLGESILPPPATLDVSALIVSIVCTLVLSIIFTLILAYIVHREGIITGILVGALFGLGLYFINYNTLTIYFEWFYVLKNPMNMINHVVFGILAGGLYETFEVEEFELVRE